jgi:hypothetical protein
MANTAAGAFQGTLPSSSRSCLHPRPADARDLVRRARRRIVVGSLGGDPRGRRKKRSRRGSPGRAAEARGTGSCQRRSWKKACRWWRNDLRREDGAVLVATPGHQLTRGVAQDMAGPLRRKFMVRWQSLPELADMQASWMTILARAPLRGGVTQPSPGPGNDALDGPSRDPARAEELAGVILLRSRRLRRRAVVVGLAFAPSLRYLDDHARARPPWRKNTGHFPMFPAACRLA